MMKGFDAFMPLLCPKEGESLLDTVVSDEKMSMLLLQFKNLVEERQPGKVRIQSTVGMKRSVIKNCKHNTELPYLGVYLDVHETKSGNPIVQIHKGEKGQYSVSIKGPRPSMILGSNFRTLDGPFKEMVQQAPAPHEDPQISGRHLIPQYLKSLFNKPSAIVSKKQEKKSSSPKPNKSRQS